MFQNPILKESKVWMLGNTVSTYCPYFREMGLRHVKEMEIGGVQQDTGTRDDCTIVVHWADGLPQGKETDKYFAFDNPKLKMISEVSEGLTFGLWKDTITSS